jgi:hypothetical protein
VASILEKKNPTFVYKDIDILVKQTKLRVGFARKKSLASQVRTMCVRMYVKQTKQRVGFARKKIRAAQAGIMCVCMYACI